jgi:hypothetical protein
MDKVDVFKIDIPFFVKIDIPIRPIYDILITIVFVVVLGFVVLFGPALNSSFNTLNNWASAGFFHWIWYVWSVSSLAVWDYFVIY